MPTIHRVRLKTLLGVFPLKNFAFSRSFSREAKQRPRHNTKRYVLPLPELPAFEVMSADLRLNRNTSGSVVWVLVMRLYVTTSTERVIVILFHRCSGMIEIPGAITSKVCVL